MIREASYFTCIENGNVRCELCPVGCMLKPGDIGLCRSRANRDGMMQLLNYGRVSAIQIDPMEKKPLYHFFPGTPILSLGNNGCNLQCVFCQNWQISQTDIETRYLEPQQVLRMVKQSELSSVAFTYAEPVVWFEFVLDSAKLLHESGVKVVLVTNGLINEKPLDDLLPWVDAMNVDIKSMNPSFYSRLCKGPLTPVLTTCERAAKTCHVEITNLVIPDQNDDPQDFHQLGQFIRDHLGPNTPLHISRYHPAYQMSSPATPSQTIISACEITRQYLHFVYPGNIHLPVSDSTHCPQCNEVLIDRTGFAVRAIHVNPDGLCPACGYRTGIITR